MGRIEEPYDGPDVNPQDVQKVTDVPEVLEWMCWRNLNLQQCHASVGTGNTVIY